jgi:multidrug efflux pump subunit AcrA (membrane-fusion protein)
MLLPGGFAEVRFKMPFKENALRVPANALLFRGEGLQVATVGEGEKIALKSITPGRDFGSQLEVLAGIEPEDRIVINPPDSLSTNQQVRIVAQSAEKPAFPK